ncbi:MAG: 50S ribosomal protein L4 [Bacteroidota bacterium]|nr:50S ribosomal protein L4 [Bacteroidota bacterium]
MELTVYNKSGEETARKVVLDETVFGIQPNDHAIYLDVKQFMANQRQGTHKSKERSELSGSTRKLKRQKGTGGARSGDIKSPVFVGGARVFGPKPRDYNFKLNKKVKALARKSALSYKAIENNIVVLEDLNFETPSTKNYAGMLNNLNIFDKKTLLVLAEENKSVYLSSRNIKQASIITASKLNTYEILRAKKLLISESCVSKISEILNKEI